MIYNEDTYCVVYHKLVREVGALEAIVFSTIAALLRKSNGIGEVSNQALMDMCGINNKMSLLRCINKLINAGYVEKREGKGRGNISIYYITEKGNNLLPISEKKGNKNDTEKVTKMNEKGNNLLPLNKDRNKEIKESGETPTPLVMEKDFLEFWDLIKASPEFDYDKQHCSDVWDRIDPEWQQKLLQQLRMGLRWRNKPNDKPYYYLLDYRGQDVQVELPIMRQGTTKCAKWIQEAQSNGEKICLMFEGEGDQQHVVYCLAKNRQICEAAGLRYCRDM